MPRTIRRPICRCRTSSLTRPVRWALGARRVRTPGSTWSRSSSRPKSGKLEDLVDLLRSRNPYRLDRNGQLNLPGFVPIPLGGLTETQGTQRLSAEPALLQLEIRLVRLPLARFGIEGLKPFGYDLFEDSPSTFAPVTDIPVPAGYVVGPGDQLRVQLYGGQNRSYPLTVSRDGTVELSGARTDPRRRLTFDAARAAIENRVSQQMIGTRGT